MIIKHRLNSWKIVFQDKLARRMVNKCSYLRSPVIGLLFLLSIVSNTVNAKNLTLEQIMADPDWMGRAPESPYWSDDATAIYFSQKKTGSPIRQLMKIDLGSGKINPVDDQQLDTSDVANGDLNRSGSARVYAYEGDILVKFLATGDVQPLTSSVAAESQPQFLLDGTVAYRQENAFFKVDLNNRVAQQLVTLKFAKKPKDWEPSKDFLGAQQRRIFDYIRDKQDNAEKGRQAALARKKANQFVVNHNIYFDPDSRLALASLSPNGRYLFVATTKKSAGEGEQDNMPRFVTEDGYVENRTVRSLVGQSEAYRESFFVIDLKEGSKHEISIAELDGISDDPLEKLKKSAAKKSKKKWQSEKTDRAVYIHNWDGTGIRWSHDGEQIAVTLFAYDNKDRWLASIDFAEHEFRDIHRLTDNAWVNDWTFNEHGWLHTSNTVYFISEESGYSHLYLKPAGKRAKKVTKGKFEVDSVTVTRDDKHIYYRANKKHPGIYEVYQLDIASGKSVPVTQLNGLNDYWLAPDEQSLLLRHSTTTRPPELFVHRLSQVDKVNESVATQKSVRQLTRTVSEEFLATDWSNPQIIEVPSSEAKQPIYSRLYLPKNFDPDREEKYPAVMFVHGAGYLQNAHQGWSLYFREFMFHTLLTQQGYVVLDMDYRASKGYGRDWRTAIYQQMGTPELADLLDGKQWLLEQANVSTERVGIYGGSYGGFLTFMALFKSPEAFAAGASLRPVTDWASYNHDYTSNILNTPEVDPRAYNRSSPIEFAAGLNKPLLIAHGMVDDNVFFKDSVRLVQRLIELRKTQWFETAIYPVEPHGFREPSSWLDEYTRIYQLFEEHVKQ